MTRLRFTRAEEEAEATRLASGFVAGLPGASSVRCVGARPDTTAPRSRSSKHAVAWIVVFKAPQTHGAVLDGGELNVAVHLETNAVAISE